MAQRFISVHWRALWYGEQISTAKSISSHTTSSRVTSSDSSRTASTEGYRRPPPFTPLCRSSASSAER